MFGAAVGFAQGLAARCSGPRRARWVSWCTAAGLATVLVGGGLRYTVGLLLWEWARRTPGASLTSLPPGGVVAIVLTGGVAGGLYACVSAAGPGVLLGPPVTTDAARVSADAT